MVGLNLNNKMENTIKNKARFFSMYLGSLLVVTSKPKESWYTFNHNEGALSLVGVLGNKIIVHRIAEQVEDRFHQCSLELKPLSLISVEEAIEVFDLNEPVNLYGITKESINIKITHKNDLMLIEYDFYADDEIGYVSNGFYVSPESINHKCALKLISMGYYVGDGTEIEYGWVKLKLK